MELYAYRQCRATSSDRGNLPIHGVRTTYHLHSARTDGGIATCGAIQSSQKSVATGKSTRLGSSMTSRQSVAPRASNKKRVDGRLFHCRQDRSPNQPKRMANPLHKKSLNWLAPAVLLGFLRAIEFLTSAPSRTFLGSRGAWRPSWAGVELRLFPFA